jgi:hypothetical protein
MASKNQGKKSWAGRRRPVTRNSGFKSTSQLRFSVSQAETLKCDPQNPLEIEFFIPAAKKDEWLGWGIYIHSPIGTKINVDSKNEQFHVGDPVNNSWIKLGGLWQEFSATEPHRIKVLIRPKEKALIGVYGGQSGKVEHNHLKNSRGALLNNMFLYAPEANFYTKAVPAKIISNNTRAKSNLLITSKSCNRCGRFLPINTSNELIHLSFTNHCKARRPCKHAGFGRISELNNEANQIQFEYGFQLECRFCKKFEVNGPLNPQRTAGQMKEDAARRRHFELLLEHVYKGSPQLRYKNLHGTDLASDIWKKFKGKCFKCGKAVSLSSKNPEGSYHLDHTRPLALLWPLDETATCLCKSCNTAKRDRPPSDFYTENQLSTLSELTGISLEDLTNPKPNIDALILIDKSRDWLYQEFLKLPELNRVRDGKRTSTLLIKALNRVIDLCPEPKPVKKFDY